MTGTVSWILSLKAIADALIGLGVIKGKNCQVKSIVRNGTATVITFAWYNEDEELQEMSFTIYDGVDGINGVDGQDGAPGDPGANGINVVSAEITDTNHLVFTMSNDTTIDAGVISSGVIDDDAESESSTYSSSKIKDLIEEAIASIGGGGGESEEPLYKVAVFSDEHTTKPTADSDWIAFCNLAKREYAHAIVGGGDLSADGDKDELDLWKSMRDTNRGTLPCYTCNGNHESKSVEGYMKYHPELMRQYLDSDADETSGQNNYFYKVIGNEIYAFVPIFEGVSEHKSQTMFSSTVLTWLHNLLEEHRNERVYLFSHIPADYHYLPTNYSGVEAYQTYKGDYEWGYPNPVSDRTTFLSLMKRYKNAIWFNGHTHVSYKEAIENNDNNYVWARYDTDGAKMVHISSLTIPSTIEDSDFTANIAAKSECIIMKVYANKIVLTYYDMISNETHDFEVDTTIVNIEPEGQTKTLSSISATKTKTSYYTDETFSTADVTVTASYNDSSTANVTSNASIGTVDITTTGTKTLSISYTENGVTKTTTISISVSERPSVKTLSSISATKTKTSYEVGETFSNADVVVTAHYSDSTTANVTSSATIGTVDTSTSGSKTLNISYSEDGVTKTTTIAITVTAEPVTKVSISATKTKTSYEVGETFLTDDVVVTMHYSDSSTSVVPHSDDDLYIGTVDTSTTGTKTLLITYDNDGPLLETTISITISAGSTPVDLGTRYDYSTSTANKSKIEPYTVGSTIDFASDSKYYYYKVENLESGKTYTITRDSTLHNDFQIYMIFVDSVGLITQSTPILNASSTQVQSLTATANDATMYLRVRDNYKTEQSYAGITVTKS